MIGWKSTFALIGENPQCTETKLTNTLDLLTRFVNMAADQGERLLIMNTTKKRNTHYGFGSYNIGQEECYDVSQDHLKHNHQSIRTAAFLMGSRRGWKFSTHKVEGKNQVQVKRVS